jgi:hypothetical protein
VYSIAFSSHLSVLEIVHVEWISMHSQCNHSPPLGVCSFIVHSRRTTLQSQCIHFPPLEVLEGALIFPMVEIYGTLRKLSRLYNAAYSSGLRKYTSDE